MLEAESELCILRPAGRALTGRSGSPDSSSAAGRAYQGRRGSACCTGRNAGRSRWEYNTFSNSLLSNTFLKVLIPTCEPLNRTYVPEPFLHSCYDDVARIEVLTEDRARFLDDTFAKEVYAAFQSFGFAYVSLDLLGYRMGSMNETLRSR